MRLAFVADCHIGNFQRWSVPTGEGGINSRCRLVLDSLRDAVKKTQALDCYALVVLGDLFDSSRPTPQIVAATQAALSEDGQNVMVLLGNHDEVSEADGDHALGPLDHVYRIDVLAKPETLFLSGGARLVAIPFQPGPAKEWLPVQLARVMDRPQHEAPCVLALHLGLSHSGTPSYIRDAPDSIDVDLLGELLDKHGIDACFAGNWHAVDVQRRGDRRLMVQCSTLVPADFTDAGFGQLGKLWVWDSRRPREALAYDIPGPRFWESKEDMALVPAASEREGMTVFVRRFTEDAETKKREEAALQQALDRKEIAGFEVKVDRREAQIKLKTAAFEARKASTADEAVARWIGRMDLAEGIGRAEVKSVVDGFLKE